MALNNITPCCPLTGCLTRVDDCDKEILIGADATIYVASRCAILSAELFDCTNAAGRGIAEIAMDTVTDPNHLFYPYTARDEGVDGTIAGTRNDNGTYTGTNTLSGEYYGFSDQVACRIQELKGAEVVIIVCLKDGDALLHGYDGGLVLSEWNFTISTGITTLTFTENNAQLPYHINVALPTVPTYTTLEAQIDAIKATC